MAEDSASSYSDIVTKLENMVQTLIVKLKDSCEENKQLKDSHCLLSTVNKTQLKSIEQLEKDLKLAKWRNRKLWQRVQDIESQLRKHGIKGCEMQSSFGDRTEEMHARLKNYDFCIEELLRNDGSNKEASRKRGAETSIKNSTDNESNCSTSKDDNFMIFFVEDDQTKQGIDYTTIHESEEQNCDKDLDSESRDEDMNRESRDHSEVVIKVENKEHLYHESEGSQGERKNTVEQNTKVICKYETVEKCREDSVGGNLEDGRETITNVEETGREMDVEESFDNVDQQATLKAVKEGDSLPNTRSRCDICDRDLQSYEILMLHKASMHPVTDNIPDKQYFCPLCSQVFKEKKMVTSHMQTYHNSKKSVFCPFCPRRFKSISSHYNAHLKTHGADPVKLSAACEVCGKQFSSEGYLKIHTDICYGIKKHICPHCKKGFGREDLLRDHMRIHTGELPYTCSICTKKFRSYAVTLNHARKTHDIKSAKDFKIYSGSNKIRK